MTARTQFSGLTVDRAAKVALMMTVFLRPPWATLSYTLRNYAGDTRYGHAKPSCAHFILPRILCLLAVTQTAHS
jgi:hypothetical protein